jgi:hydrogenase maturation protease
MASSTCILGIGSPHGDDQAGWRVIDDLRDCQPCAATRRAIETPLQLIECLDGCRQLILIDACRLGDAPGTLTRWTWPEPGIQPLAGHSTHGWGLTEALQLAHILRRLPEKVILYTVEVGDCRPGAELTPVVSHALAELRRRVLAEVSPD